MFEINDPSFYSKKLVNKEQIKPKAENKGNNKAQGQKKFKQHVIDKKEENGQSQH